jgi:photosystem II stability/assembly factor-like uncharacterized protein
MTMRVHSILVVFVLTSNLLLTSCVASQWRRTHYDGGFYAFVQVDSLTLAIGGSVQRSTDNGVTWSLRYPTAKTSLYFTGDIAAAVIGSHVMLGGAHLINSSNTASFGGVYRSVDTGFSWEPMNQGLSDTDVYSLALCGSKLFAGTGTGIFVSTNEGVGWQRINLSQTAIIYYIAIVASTILAGSDKGIFRSIDSGLTWTGPNSDLKLDARYSYTTLIANGSKFICSALYQGKTINVYLSSDTGLSWTRVGGVELTSMIASNGRLFRAKNNAYGEVFMSPDDGRTWTDITDVGIKQGQSFHRAKNLAVSGPNLIVSTVNTGTWYCSMSSILSHVSVDRALPFETDFTIRPNPLSSSTSISFLTQRRTFARVQIVDVLGKECAQIFTGVLDPGAHEYQWNGGTMPAGVYFCTVRTENGIVQMPMIVQHQ